MTFEEYLKKKKIAADAFQKAQPERYAEWEQLFAAVHPESFTMQKKFLLNEIRGLYLLADD